MPKSNIENRPHCEAPLSALYLIQITEKFLLAMLIELISIFNVDGNLDVNFNEEETWVSLAGSVGWGKAFVHACDVTNLQKVKEYYTNLSWYDSDNFDADVIDLALKYHVIKEME